MGTASATRAAHCAAWLNAERSWSPVGDGRALPALGCSEAAAPQQWDGMHNPAGNQRKQHRGRVS